MYGQEVALPSLQNEFFERAASSITTTRGSMLRFPCCRYVVPFDSSPL
jgi:hypothetical protein